MTRPILTVRDLRAVFETEDRTVRAVDGVSYELFPGKCLAVVGESGCGKSVHALSILRLLPEPPGRIVSGEVLFDGKDILARTPEQVRGLRGDRIAMIFQEPMTSLNPVMRVGDQIAEAVTLHRGYSAREAEDRAASLLSKVGIPEARRRLRDYPHQFSGGMRQRAMIAMALSCEPDILIADEPTTALDVTIQAQILELLRSLQAELGMALVLITHNLGVVAECADDVVVMYAGRTVEKAGSRELFEEPLHPYTRALLGSVPSPFARAEKLTTVSGQPPELDRPFRGCPFAPRCPEALERCRNEDPPEFLMPGGRASNCWLAEERAESRQERSGSEAPA